MPLPDIHLDELHAQALLDQARLRITTFCPEWTDYNVSDPGITLLELIAWKTEKLSYQLNRVPDKMLRRLMDLMGIDRLEPAVSAKAEITFRLATPFPLANRGNETIADIPGGAQVATRRQNDEPEVVFTTRTGLRVGALAIDRVLFEDYPRAADALIKPEENRVEFRKPFALFGESPQENKAFYISFVPMVAGEHTPAGHVVRLTFSKSEQAGSEKQVTGTGYTASAPPWVWETWDGRDWVSVPLGTAIGEELDTTNGFNLINGKGALVLYLPASMKPTELTWDTQNTHNWWVRCRLGKQLPGNTVRESPRILTIEAQVIGGAVEAENAVVVEGELLGISDGKPGQVFKLRNEPALAFETHPSNPLLDECVEVEREGKAGAGQWERWTRVDDFGDSKAHSRHYCLDEVSGEIVFGPAIHQRDGTVRQHGAVPALGLRMRVSRYRYSLGARGNLKAGKIIVPKTAIPYIDGVFNRNESKGGLDVESMELARMRARRVMKTQDRAVTAEDYENLLLARFNTKDDRGRRQRDKVARARCLTRAELPALPMGAVRVVVIPGPFDPNALNPGTLQADAELLREVKDFLDDYRLITTTVSVAKAQFVPVDVNVTLPKPAGARVSEAALEALVANVVQRLFAPALPHDRDATKALYRKANMPLDEDIFDAGWAGWPFGKALEDGIVQATLMRLPAVRYVKAVDFRKAQFNEDQTQNAAPSALPFEKTLALRADELPLLQTCKVSFA